MLHSDWARVAIVWNAILLFNPEVAIRDITNSGIRDM